MKRIRDRLKRRREARQNAKNSKFLSQEVCRILYLLDHDPEAEARMRDICQFIAGAKLSGKVPRKPAFVVLIAVAVLSGVIDGRTIYKQAHRPHKTLQ